MKKITLLILAVLLTLVCNQQAYSASKIGQVDFEQSLSDSYGFVHDFENSEYVTYVSGHTGYSARSSHAGDDGSGTADFCITTNGSDYWPSSGELYLKAYIKYEAEYQNISSNVKWLWTQDDPHNEIIYSKDSTEGVLSLRWQCSGGDGGWNEDSGITKYGSVSYTKGDWMLVEIYFKLSTGDTHLNPDGIQWIKVNGETVISGTQVKTGMPGRLSFPAINATTNQPTGHGWWQIDDFEVWDGIPTGSSNRSINGCTFSGGSIGSN